MIELTRRSFLKSIATLAASSFVPVEITKTIDYLVTQPELPITKSNPSGWMKIDGEMFPIINMNAYKDIGLIYPTYTRWGNDYKVVSSITNEPSLWNMNVKYFDSGQSNYIYSLIGHRVDFEINPLNSNLSMKGNGYISEYSYSGILVAENSPIYEFNITTEDITFETL